MPHWHTINKVKVSKFVLATGLLYFINVMCDLCMLAFLVNKYKTIELVSLYLSRGLIVKHKEKVLQMAKPLY